MAENTQADSRADSRDKILQACERTIARSGLRSFRMQDVAREAGVSIGLLSYHFGDRDGLLQAALDHVNARSSDRAGRTPHAHTPAQRLSALLCSEFGDDAQVRAGSIVWNELRAVSVFEPTSAAALTRSTAEWQSAVETLIGEAILACTPQDHEPEQNTGPAATALLLTALVEGLSGRWLTGQITADEAQHAVRFALHGLGLSESDAPGVPSGA
ncbi:TetR/AcrR family transcriptional regulator [Leucobacter insecticola]|uniref:TetR/AcrR family transcriptional regulator n=1 Tax=Leucobacter insecticola TaxID=2714934 RepID=UPI001FCCA819|nr:TetR/AcrR family transcriptional regulator [Leucobacter insecticola]